MTFEELYQKVIFAKANDKPFDLKEGDYDKGQLDCILHPENYPLIRKEGDCDCKDPACISACIFDAIKIEHGTAVIHPELCVGCAECLRACKDQKLDFTKDTVTAIESLKDTSHSVYALMAPAFIGQFGADATPSKIRNCLKQIGFAGMVEVAAFADILTLKESLEFIENHHTPEDFQLTSCCCPVWIGMIRKDFKKIVSHLPASVSPMIACGRIIKALHPDCRTIFIGPCMAKKAEAKDPDLTGAIDCVLTFQELADMFHAFQTDFSAAEAETKEHSSTAGRLYGRAGGVSKAVGDCVKSIQPDYLFLPKTACGVKDCKTLLEQILAGETRGNFFEGMACDGGCAGGPKRLLDIDACTTYVNEYAEQSPFATPAENPYVADLMERLGFHTVEDFVEHSDILTRSL
ncbi:MAG: iron hydrogenase [Lachnospiraceae bacterium]|nr:iron hydrogenase [Lachnospiraceae bacterium]